MEEKLKNKIYVFVKNMVKKIDKKESIPEIQQELDEIIEFIDNTLTIFSKKESEEIEKAINEYESNRKSYEEQIRVYTAQKNSDDETIKVLKEKLSNNSVLDEQYKKLNEDYNKLKQKVNKENNELSGYQLKIKNNEKLLNDLQEEINKVKKENFEKKEVILNLQNEIKQDKTKIDEYEKKINKYISEKSDLTKENVELRNKNSAQEKNYKNRISVLEKQLKNLSEANNNFVQENNDVQTQLKDFQMYTNMAKVNTKKLNKEDFSILEVMSKRAETAEMEVQKLLAYIDELKSLNEQITNKIKPLEDYALLQIKHDHEIRLSNDSLLDIQNKIFTDEERKEIDKLKNRPNELFQTLIKLKTENLELHKHIKDITVECNQQLREARWKNK
jgi:chromosome segregation ATPase